MITAMCILIAHLARAAKPVSLPRSENHFTRLRVLVMVVTMLITATS